MSEDTDILKFEIQQLRDEIQSIKKDLQEDIHPALKLITHYLRRGSLRHLPKLTDEKKKELEEIILNIENHVKH